MPDADLKKRLSELRLQGDNSFTAYKSSRDQLYKTIASAYLFWRQCEEQDKAFLPSQYKAIGIKWNKPKDNRVNFNPLIQLVFDIRRDNTKDSNKITHWAAVLRCLDEDYTENPQAYQSNALVRLVILIGQRGGITEIYKRDENGEPLDDDDGFKPTKPTKKDLAEIARILGKRKVEELKQGEHPSLAVLPKTLSDITYNEDGFVALIGRRDAKGQLQLLTSTADADVIGSVAFKSMRDYAADIDPSLRIIAETIHSQTFPQSGKPLDSKLEKEWRRVVETDDTKVSKLVERKDDDGNVKTVNEKLTNPRRLIILGAKDQLIYSKMREASSVVTLLKPSLSLCGKDSIFLKTEERRAIEEPILDGTLPVFNAKPKQKLAAVTGQKYAYLLELLDPATKRQRDLHFYKRETKPGQSATNFQPTFDAGARYKPVWRFTADRSWFLRLRSEWLDRWFESLGKNTRILRSDSKVFELRVSKDNLFIRFEIDDPKFGDKHNAKIFGTKITGTELQSCLVLSLDLAPVLFNLSEISYADQVTVSGDGHAVVFDYKTTSGEFRVAMPTVSRVGGEFIRDTTHFSRAEF